MFGCRYADTPELTSPMRHVAQKLPVQPKEIARLMSAAVCRSSVLSTYLCAFTAAMVRVLPPAALILLSPFSKKPSSPDAETLERAGAPPGVQPPESAWVSSGSAGAVLLLMDTNDASDLQQADSHT